MRMRFPLFVLIVLLTLPQTTAAQGFGIGARAGSLGFGAEGALSLSDNFVLRAGIGSFIFEFDGELDGVDYTVSPPSMTGTVGIDLYPAGGSFRLMAGLMIRDGDFEVQSGELSEAGSIEIGDGEYDSAGTLHGTFASKSTAPFVGLGFGHHTKGGFGFFMDFGVAFVGEPDVSLTPQGAIASVPGIQQDLDREIQYLEDDAAAYMKYWPIINLGVKIPIG